jgi:hypothetical protein
MGDRHREVGGSSACAPLGYSQVEVWTGGGGLSATPALATGPPNPRSMTTSEPEARRRFMAQSNPIRRRWEIVSVIGVCRCYNSGLSSTHSKSPQVDKSSSRPAVLQPRLRPRQHTLHSIALSVPSNGDRRRETATRHVVDSAIPRATRPVLVLRPQQATTNRPPALDPAPPHPL